MAISRSASRSSKVAEEIRESIDRGELKPSDRLPPERRLAEQFGVSRVTIRRALAKLSEDGLIFTYQGSGNYVQRSRSMPTKNVFETARPLELMDVRFALEPHICRLAVLNALQSDFDKLESLLLEMEASILDTTRFADADTRFHTFLVETTGNQLLIWISSQINSVRSQRQWTKMRHLTLEPIIISQYNKQHRAIVDAIRSRTPEEAANCMKDHLETARLSLTRASAT